MIRVQAEDFDPGVEMERLTRGRSDAGAVVTFTGLVRDSFDGRALASMTLEHYPEMTERELARIEGDAVAKWGLAGSLIVHRHGRLKPGDRIVFVATAAPHRQAAFDAAAYLMDYLKTQAPFWKKEEFADGGARWVDACGRDVGLARRWAEPIR